MKNTIKCITISTILVLASLFSIGNVYAEDYGAGAYYVFGPTSQEIFLKPGESYRSSVYISNPNDSMNDVKILLYVTPYNIINEQYDPSFDQETSYNQIVKWITLDQTEFVLSPNEKIDVGFTIEVPEDAPGGGQYAAIIAQNYIDGDSVNGGGVNITDVTSIGSIVVAQVAGKTKENGQIIENSIPAFLFNNKLTAVSKVKNEGNVHTKAKYTLQVWPLFSDEEICTNEEEPTKSLIVPDTERVHIEECNQLPIVGIVRAKQTVEIFGEKSEVEKMIFVCPLWLLFLIIAAAILVIMWFVSRIKRNKE